MPQLILALMVLAGVGSYSGQAQPLLVDPARECARVWRQKGFSSVAGPGKNTLFQTHFKESYPEFYDRTERASCWKEWLVVIYMAADNDLSPYAYRDIWEMEALGSLVSMDAIVFLDSAPQDGMRYYHLAKRQREIDYKGRLAAFVKKEELETESSETQEEKFLAAQGPSLVQSPVQQSLEEGDSGDVRTAGRFLEWALERYPSRRILLIGWSHGQGFDARLKPADVQGFGGNGKQGGFAFDSTSKTHMAVTDMAKGMERLLRDYRQGRALDLAGSDACLNQQVEFGYEWTGLADYVFGSSTIVQKKGFNYRSLFDWFQRRPGASTEELAKELPLIYGRSVSKQAHGPYSSYHDKFATMATWAMPALLPLKRGLDDLGQALLSWMGSGEVKGKKARRRELREQISEVKTLGGVSYDLFNLLQTLESWSSAGSQNPGTSESERLLLEAITREARLTDRALTASVMQSFVGEAYQQGLLRTSKGVAVWLPADHSEFQTTHPKFAKGKFYQAEDGSGISAWGRFTETLFSKD